MEYIIVQAGGKGSRMGILTQNKPKALVPVNNLPMLFHLFRKYPASKFIIIGDYKYEVLERYLATFAQDVHYQLVRATGHEKTCAGMHQAVSLIPDGQRFLLIWCDLILPQTCEIPESGDNWIGIAKDFSCRWKYEHGQFAEERSDTQGVAGFFIFQNKASLLQGGEIPQDGEFVRWLQSKNMTFEEFPLYGTKEYGLYSEWEKLPKMRCRPFNQLDIKMDKIIKKPIDEQGRILSAREIAWYQTMAKQTFPNIPKIFSYSPLTMEYIEGKNVYEYSFLPADRKKTILQQIIACLKTIHSMSKGKADDQSFYDAYIGKTFARLEKIKNLVPYANEQTLTINGRKCRNIFFCREEVERIVTNFMPNEFCLIHGDCTFSNIMLRQDTEPVFIDPRGYFGQTQLLGDPAYDWVKLYYSLFSNYDQFNLKRFTLTIDKNNVRLDIASNNWENMEDEFFRQLDGEITRLQMKMLLAITWLSLTTYAWEDYDSICAAFYNGLYYLEDALSMESAYGYFASNMQIIEQALRSISGTQMEALINDSLKTLQRGNKIIVSGLGKNVPIGEKFAGTMLSMNLNAGFLHTNSAVHGDMGMIRPGDLVILLTKSGETEESVYLADLLKKRDNVLLWLLTFRTHSMLTERIAKHLVIHLKHEGDMWNIVPNNSTTLNLIVLQTLAMELAKRMKLDLNKDFRPNHPGGAIGAHLRSGVI